MSTKQRNISYQAFLFIFLLFICAGSLYADKIHKIVLHVDENDPKKLNLVLSNASNINKYYQDKGEEVIIEIVAYGPGLHMFRNDTSPVKTRLKSISQSYDNVTFKACNTTHETMERDEGKKVSLSPLVELVPSGIIYIIQRQEQGWTYIKP